MGRRKGRGCGEGLDCKGSHLYDPHAVDGGELKGSKNVPSPPSKQQLPTESLFQMAKKNQAKKVIIVITLCVCMCSRGKVIVLGTYRARGFRESCKKILCMLIIQISDHV